MSEITNPKTMPSMAEVYSDVYWAIVNAAPDPLKKMILDAKESQEKNEVVDEVIRVIAKAAEVKYDQLLEGYNKKLKKTFDAPPSLN